MSETKLIWIVLLLVGTPKALFGCTCLGFGPACTEAVSPHVTAIFLGTVESVTRVSENLTVDPREMSATVRGDISEVTFHVRESYKGVSTPTVVVRTNSSEAACGFPFKAKQEYLVYASAYGTSLYTSICQRTMPARFATDDLKYLRSMSSLPNMSTVRGTYKRYTFNPDFVPKFTPSIMDHYRPPEEDYEALSPMTGEAVTLTSNTGQVLTTKVSDDGKFLFAHLSPGRYSVSASVPANFAPAQGYIAGLGLHASGFDVLPKGCVEVTFRTQPDGRIRGRIVDSNGRPLANVKVLAWKTGDKFNFYMPFAQADDEKDGTFDIGPLPPGRYIVGGYVWVLPQGFPAMADEREQLTNATLRFFSNATQSSRATSIQINLGQKVSDITLQIPFVAADWTWVKAAP